MIYRLTHTTTYHYGGVVSLSHHLLRLQPRELPRQRCLLNELQIEPRPERAVRASRLFWQCHDFRHH